MKNSMVIIFSIFVTLVFISGCAQNKDYSALETGKYLICTITHNKNMQTGAASVDEHSSNKVIIDQASSFIDDNHLKISGKVKNISNCTIFSGHIDILIEAPDGKIIDSLTLDYYPKIIKQKGSKEAYFTIKLDNQPPTNSIVHLKFHDEAASFAEPSVCLKKIN